MKKTIILTLIALSLVACEGKDLDDPRVKDALNQKEIAENIEDESKEEAQVEQENESTNEEDEEINRTYPEEKTKKEVIDVENSANKDDEKDEKDKEDKEEKDKSSDEKLEKDKKDKKKDGKDKEEGKSSDEKKEELTEDDYFFSYYDLVTVREGEVVNVLTGLEDYGDNYFVDYVPFSNNILVAGSVMDQDFAIRKINGQELTLMYDFKENETFYPLAMIGDKIYGRYQYYENYDMKKNSNFVPEKSGIGVVDLKTGELNIFKATHTKANESLIGQGVSDKEILFTKMEGNEQFNLYKLDLEKGFDQEAELVEEDTKASYFLSSKNFKDGNANYEIFKSNENVFEINGKKYTVDDVKRMTLIGQNIIIQEPTNNSDDPDHLFKMDIINYLTGETVEKDLEAFGYRVYNGKFYYIDYDKKVQSLDIGL